MSLADTGLAVGSVSRFLTQLLTTALTNAPYNPLITVQRPQQDPPTGSAVAQGRLNLFLYEVEIDAAMRNVQLTPGVPAPLWVVLRYVLTAFDTSGESDTAESHDILGMGMQVLTGLNDLLPDVGLYNALTSNPEPLKLTFDQGTPDLLSRLMQGPDDKYRCSVPFQIRPVLIAQPVPPVNLQLVGINYLLGTTIGAQGIQNFVLPTLGPHLESAQPAAVQVGDTLVLSGGALNSPGLTVLFGSATLTPTMQQEQQLAVVIAGLDPSTMSAGNVTVTIVQLLANGLSISSEATSVALTPTVNAMTAVSLAAVSATNPNVYGTIHLSGVLLGGPNDYVEFALVQSGVVALLLDGGDPSFTPPADQTAQQFAIPVASAVAPGLYYVIFRVNGQQARQPFTLNMVTP